MAAELVTVDARNKLEDLSGIAIKPGENPYQAFINACNDNPEEINALYTAHRTKRNEQQKEKFLSQEFKELVIDQYLLRLERPEIEPGFQDPRNCLVFWARPPDHVVRLAAHVQGLLKAAAPRIWLMPQHRMHMTTLEITHSLTPDEIAILTASIRPSVPKLVNHTYAHRARLIKPMISYDLSAFALSFVPATPSSHRTISPPPVVPALDKALSPETVGNDAYTYHHLRRDMFDLVKEAGAEINSRYQVPSAHITLGRYLGLEDHETPEARAAWVDKIDEINAWLEKEAWGEGDEWIGEWVVGQERGLDCRIGALWYGGGRTVMTGEGF